MKQAVENLKYQIEREAGSAVADLRPYASGNNAALYLVDVKGGGRLIAKIATRPGAKLDLEAWMLRYLAEHSRLPVPEVIHSTASMLIMTYLPGGPALNDKAEYHAAALLADLHAITADHYGLMRDTLIGALDQPNLQERDWLTFFREHRLLCMARAAMEEGRIEMALLRRIEKLALRLEDYIVDPAPPSLLHGDVWGGNVLALNDRISGFIDPAIYYGDPEIELAFASLFGTFGPAFFRRYNELRPLKPGFFEVRKDLYNLYPLLVHVRLFGGSYVQSVSQIVNRLAA